LPPSPALTRILASSTNMGKKQLATSVKQKDLVATRPTVCTTTWSGFY
jgi:hypothetical protein